MIEDFKTQNKNSEKMLFLQIILTMFLPFGTLGLPNYIDLTHPFKADQPRWPGSKSPKLTSLGKGLQDAGDTKVYISLNEFYTVSKFIFWSSPRFCIKKQVLV